MKNIIILGVGAILVLALGGFAYLQFTKGTPEIACPTDVQMCPDGSSVGRSGPSCAFPACPEVPEKKYKDDLLIIDTPELDAVVSSPVTITGQAKGTYYYEGSFRILILDDKGQLIGDGVAAAQSDWATESFVPFTATILYALPPGNTAKSGKIVLQNDNPSGLPENSIQRSFPVTFREAK